MTLTKDFEWPDLKIEGTDTKRYDIVPALCQFKNLGTLQAESFFVNLGIFFAERRKIRGS